MVPRNYIVRAIRYGGEDVRKASAYRTKTEGKPLGTAAQSSTTAEMTKTLHIRKNGVYRSVRYRISLHERHISFYLSYDTAALLFWRVLHFLLLNSGFPEQHYTLIVGWQAW